MTAKNRTAKAERPGPDSETGSSASGPDLEAIREAYLGKSDFTFEVEVRDRLERLGHRVQHGGKYQDQVTDKWRDLDLFIPGSDLTIRSPDGKTCEPLGTTMFCIECKNVSADYPIVVGVREEGQVFVGGLSVHKRRGRLEVGSGRFPLGKWSVFRDRFGDAFVSMIGVEVQQVPVNQPGKQRGAERDSGFDKWSQPLSHAASRYHDHLRKMSADSTEGFRSVYCVPILVVPEQRLFRATHVGGQVIVDQADAVAVRVEQEVVREAAFPEAEFSPAAIPSYFICTLDGLMKLMSVFGS